MPISRNTRSGWVCPRRPRRPGRARRRRDAWPFARERQPTILSRTIPAFCRLQRVLAIGDVTADVVYANYGRPEDFQKLKDLGID